jgi:hypothetical protein
VNFPAPKTSSARLASAALVERRTVPGESGTSVQEPDHRKVNASHGSCQPGSLTDHEAAWWLDRTSD